MSEWQDSVTNTLTQGTERGEVRPDVDIEAVASVLIAALTAYLNGTIRA